MNIIGDSIPRRDVVQISIPVAKTPNADLTTEWDDLVRFLGGRFQRVATGTLLLTPWDEARPLSVLRSGLVKLFVSRADGTERIIRFAQPMDVIGLPRALGELQSVHFARTISDAEVAFLPPKTVLRAIQDEPKVNKLINRMLATIIAQLCNQEASLHGDNSERHVAAALCLLVHNCGLSKVPLPIEVRLSRQDLADFLALHRVSVYRALRYLSSQGWVDYHADSLRILNLESLRAYSTGV